MQGRGKLDFGVHTLAKGACHILELSIFYLAPQSGRLWFNFVVMQKIILVYIRFSKKKKNTSLYYNSN